MLKTTILLYVAGLASPVFSAPKPTGDAVETASPPHSTSKTIIEDTAYGARPTGMVNSARGHARTQKTIDEPPEYFTIEITNSMGSQHQTKTVGQAHATGHASNAGCPTPVGGPREYGTIPDGTSASLVVPTGWAGNVGITRANMPLTGIVTLLEASIVVPLGGGWEYAVADVDVSLVTGFTIPITCHCNGARVSGCNKDLFEETPGSFDEDVGAVSNPLHGDETATHATSLFTSCEGLAYTFPYDHAANTFGACQSGLVSCCVGTACPM